jgi:hypothetical protein
MYTPSPFPTSDGPQVVTYVASNISFGPRVDFICPVSTAFRDLYGGLYGPGSAVAPGSFRMRNDFCTGCVC